MLQYFTSNVDVHHIFVSDCFRWQPREIKEETVPGRTLTPAFTMILVLDQGKDQKHVLRIDRRIGSSVGLTLIYR